MSPALLTSLDPPIAIGGMTSHQSAFPGSLQLSPSGPLQDFGPLVLGEEPLHPQEHFALRRVVHRAIEELWTDSRLLELFQDKVLIDGLAGQPVRRVNQDYTELSGGEVVPQLVQSGTVQRRTAVSFIQILSEHSISFVLGVLPKGIEDFTEAIDLNPAFAEALRSRGLGYLALGREADAIEDFQKYLALSPQASDHLAVQRILTNLRGDVPVPPAGEVITLNQALKLGWVRVEIHGLGVASGDSILIKVQRSMTIY